MSAHGLVTSFWDAAVAPAGMEKVRDSSREIPLRLLPANIDDVCPRHSQGRQRIHSRQLLEIDHGLPTIHWQTTVEGSQHFTGQEWDAYNAQQLARKHH